jgi:hypothetical protein
LGIDLFGFNTDKQWDYENGFWLTSHMTRFSKMLAHYELYRSILHLPGHIIECGVYKGASLVRFATFREIMESPYSRKIIGFDAFGRFPEQSDPLDASFVAKFERAGGDGISVDEMNKVLQHKSFENVELVPGDILSTVPRYVEDHPELRISLLHIDVDVYEPTSVSLKHFYDRVVAGGLILFDDFGTVAGETRAIDEFFYDKDVSIQKLPISHIPSFIRKRRHGVATEPIIRTLPLDLRNGSENQWSRAG